jgi:nitrous oxide reductase accessory protein NosL
MTNKTTTFVIILDSGRFIGSRKGTGRAYAAKRLRSAARFPTRKTAEENADRLGGRVVRYHEAQAITARTSGGFHAAIMADLAAL